MSSEDNGAPFEKQSIKQAREQAQQDARMPYAFQSLADRVLGFMTAGKADPDERTAALAAFNSLWNALKIQLYPVDRSEMDEANEQRKVAARERGRARFAKEKWEQYDELGIERLWMPGANGWLVRPMDNTTTDYQPMTFCSVPPRQPGQPPR